MAPLAIHAAIYVQREEKSRSVSTTGTPHGRRLPAYITSKGVKLGLSGEAVMVGQLCATSRGVAHCVLQAVPAPSVIPLHEVFRYPDLTRFVDPLAAGSEAPPVGAGEPTF